MSRKVLGLIGDIVSLTQDFPGTILETKNKKQEEALQRASSKIYTLHSPLTNVFRELKMSYLLGCNDVIVGPFINECARFYMHYEDLVNESQTPLVKQNQQVTAHYKKILPTFKKKEMVGAMLEDLEHFSSEFNFSFDRKEAVDIFKYYTSYEPRKDVYDGKV